MAEEQFLFEVQFVCVCKRMVRLLTRMLCERGPERHGFLSLDGKSLSFGGILSVLA